MKIGHAQFGRTSIFRRVRGFRASALVITALFLALMLASCGPGGSSAVDSSTGSTDNPTPTPVSNVTLTGTVYDNMGNTLNNKPGVVFLFSSAYTLGTNASGQFSLDGITGNHTLLYSDPTSGFSDYLRWVSLASGTVTTEYFPLQSFSGTSKTIPALSGDFLISNELTDASSNGYTATLLVPAQISGKFNYNGALVNSLPISLENIDLNKALPFPLPESRNRTAGLNNNAERQAPVVVVNVGPGLLRDLEPNASQPGGAPTILTLPDPYNTPALKVLHYNAEAHEWQTVPNPANGNQPYTLADARNGMRVKEGGFYGVFAEDRSHLGNASGIISKPAGTIVFLGDKFQVLGADGRVNFTDIHVPYNGRTLTVTIIDPSSEPPTTSTSVFMVDGSNNEIPDIGDEVAQVILTALPEAKVTADGTSTITIQADVKTSSGKAARNGIVVNFSLSPANLADLSVGSVQTSGGTGRALVTLTSRTTVSNDLKVKASAQGIAATDLSVSLVPGAPATVLLTTAKNSLEANGTDNTVLTARVRDAFGHPVASGTTVTFSAYKPDGSEYSEIDPKIVTIENDKAEATLTASATAAAGVYTVTAVSGSVSKSLPIAFTSAPVGSVVISSGTTEIVANGTSYVSLLATVKNQSGLPMPDGTLVVFTTTAGTLAYTAGGGGTSQYIGTVAGQAGQVRIKLYSGTIAAVADISAEAGGQRGSTSVKFIPGAAASVHVSADPATLLADGISISNLQAIIVDAYGNIVKDGTIANLSITAGTGRLSALQKTTSGGVVEFTYTAPSTAPAGNAATIKVQVGSVFGTTIITLTAPVIATVTLTANPVGLPADGKSTGTITATVTLAGGAPAPDGLAVDFSIIDGGGSITPSSTTSGGVALATLTAGSTPGTATIRAEVGGRRADIQVPYQPGNVAITIVPSSVLGTGRETALVKAVVTQADGSAVTGTAISFSLSDEEMGDLDPYTANTDSKGYTEVKLKAGTKGGTLTVTGTWMRGGTEVKGSGDIIIQAPPAVIDVASVSQAAISQRGQGGNTTSVITFNVRDSQNQSVANGYRVNFAIQTGPNGGETLTPLYAYTQNGQVSTTLRSGFKSGPLTIKATYNNDTNVTSTTSWISISNGPPVGEAFALTSQYLNVSGLNPVTPNLSGLVYATVGDIVGNSVPDSTSISFKTYNTGGLFPVPSSALTVNGSASINYTRTPVPAPISGFSSLTAEVNNGGRTTRVTSISVAPNEINTIFIGTNGGGVYKSTDGGSSWVSVSRSTTLMGQNWINPYVNDVAVDPNDLNTVWAATGYGGTGALYRSRNGGATWDSGRLEEVSGVFSTTPKMAISKILCDNDAVTSYMWVGTSGKGVYYTDNRTKAASAVAGGLSFTQAEGLGNGIIVTDIVRSPATHGATAVIYVATPAGVYRSTNGGRTFSLLTRFTGDNITALDIYNNGSDMLYAGTADNGVWVYDSALLQWTKSINGLGVGLRATKPVMAAGGIGNGTIDNLVVTDADTQTETWTLTCVATAPTTRFSVAGSVSGVQAAQAATGTPYASTQGEVSFSVIQGETPFAIGDTFTFDTIRDPALSIKDVLVDMNNQKIYAITRFDGALEPHASGNIWVHDLEATGHIYDGVPATPGFSVLWRTANLGLPQYDPPDDTTLFPMHVLAFDNPANPSKVFAGGEGIHLYKAAKFIGATNMLSGILDWYASESGLTNLLMARTIVLTTGVCEITGLSQAVKEQPGGGYIYEYEWYVEDENGNPPIAGSTMEIKYYKSNDPTTPVATVLLEKYGDVLTNRGTRRSGIPFRAAFGFGGSYDYAELVFTAFCDSIATPPGCSGASQIYGVPFSTGDVYLETSSSAIPADGASTTTLTATVRNTDGSPIGDGVLVRFFSTLGTLSADTAFTAGGLGQASVTLTSGTVSGTASVYAVSGQSTSGMFSVVFTSGATSAMTMTASPGTLSADGYSSSTITATARDVNGNLISDNTGITFTVTDPFGAPHGDPTVALTASGSARFTFTATQQDGTYTIMARSPNGITRTTQVILTPEQAATLTFIAASGVDDPTVVADGTSFVTLVATVLNTAGLPVKDGTVVSFNTTGGSLGGPGSVSTLNKVTAGGQVTVDLYSPQHTGTGTVTASVLGLNAALSVSFIPGPVAEIRLSATPASLEANGTNTSQISVTVLDANGNPVADDSTIITFSLPASQGRLSALTLKPTGGMGTITYTTPSSVPSGGYAYITATATNGITETATILLNGPTIGGITLTSDPTTLPRDGVSKATIFATVTLQGGGAAPDGTQVVFSIVSVAGSGTLSAYTRTTAGGIAMTTLTSSMFHESVTIRGTCAGRNHDLTVPYTPGKVALTVIPNTLKGTGTETASVRVTVTDAAGDPADYTAVTFSLSDESMGTLTPRTANTSAVGYTEVTFLAGTNGGDVDVTASWTTPGGEFVTGSATITIQPPPASIQISDMTPLANPNPASISIKGTGGQSTSLLVFDVKDSQNQYVADGYRINFRLETGPDGGEAIVPLYAYTKDGRVSTILKSGLKSGTVTIRATYANDTNVTTASNQVAIDNGPPVGEEFGMFAQYFNISGLRLAGLQDPVTAVAADIYGQAIPDNTAISFKTYNTGGLFPVPASAGTVNGVATRNLMSGGGLTPVQGFLSATMEANNGGRTTHVTSIAVVPAAWNKNTMFVGTNGGGVYKSVDGGASWNTVSRSSTLPGQNWIDPYVNDVAVDPDEPNLVFAATGYAGKGALYRSFNGGQTWNSDNSEEVFGMLNLTSAITTILADEGSDYLWIGTAGGGVYYYTDCAQTSALDNGWGLTEAATGLVEGKYIRDLAKSPDGSTGSSATLYAATLSRVWTSSNGGQDWAPLGTSFSGSSIKTIEVTRDALVGDIVWAGTDDAGIWVYTVGTDWVQYNDGLGNGVRATTPVLTSASTGNGTISGGVFVGTNTVNETWTLTCTAAAANGGTFSLSGTVSGAQATAVTVGSLYHSDTGDISFTITDGEADFVVGDTFTFRTVRDPGNQVVDILLDTVNHYAYAISYFWGSAEPHAVGSVYVRPLTAEGLPDVVAWSPVTDGLPQYDPPDDTSLFAQRVLAVDDPVAPGALFAGGEGIHMFKATHDGSATRLDQGALYWQVSEAGLTNLIMARSPMLFTGGVEFYMDSKSVAGHTTYTDVTYTWRIEDLNGNPPIHGSTMVAKRYKLKDDKYELIDTIPIKDYGDEMRSAGTWYDKNDQTTYRPFVWSARFKAGTLDKVELVFTAYCDTDIPGCSGGQQMIVSEIGNY